MLLGGAGVLLAACGASSTKGAGTGTGKTAASAAGSGGPVLRADQYQLVQFFKSGTPPAGVAHRLPFGLGSTDGVLQAGGPQQMDVRILDADGKTDVVPPSVATRHANQLQRPYWPVIADLAAGRYQAVFSLGGATVGSPAFFDVGSVAKLPKQGDKLPPVATPTPVNGRGVNPICTRTPACGLHDVSLDTVLGKSPVVLMVATPAYCQTAICGPTLDVLLDNRRPGITYIHAEVWKDTTLSEPAPLLDAYGIDYEPVLFVVRADGTIAERLDVIFDADDLAAALAKAL